MMLKVNKVMVRKAFVFFMRLWKEILSYSIIAIPLTILFYNLHWPQLPQSVWMLGVGTIFSIITLARFFEKMFCYEILIFFVYPSAKTFTFGMILYSVRLWKEVCLSKKEVNYSRSSLYVDLGFMNFTKICSVKYYAYITLMFAWLFLFGKYSGLFNAHYFMWIPFFLMTIGYALHLTSVRVEKP